MVPRLSRASGRVGPARGEGSPAGSECFLHPAPASLPAHPVYPPPQDPLAQLMSVQAEARWGPARLPACLPALPACASPMVGRLPVAHPRAWQPPALATPSSPPPTAQQGPAGPGSSTSGPRLHSPTRPATARHPPLPQEPAGPVQPQGPRRAARHPAHQAAAGGWVEWGAPGCLRGARAPEAGQSRVESRPCACAPCPRSDCAPPRPATAAPPMPPIHQRRLPTGGPTPACAPACWARWPRSTSRSSSPAPPTPTRYWRSRRRCWAPSPKPGTAASRWCSWPRPTCRAPT